MHPLGLGPGALLVWGPSNTFQTFLSVYTLISSSQSMDYVCIKMWFLGPGVGLVPLGTTPGAPQIPYGKESLKHTIL